MLRPVCHSIIYLCANVKITPYLGEFDDWSEWGDCSTTCGEGTRTRTRTCPGPYECIGEDIETVTCPNNPTCTTIHLENIQAFQECTDDPSVANCKLLAKNGYCSKHELYAKFCCKSCTLAGQLRG